MSGSGAARRDTGARAGSSADPDRDGTRSSIRSWTGRLVRNTVLWMLPAAVLWAALTPRYNWFLLTAGENLVRLTESPDVTRLDPRERHYAVIARLDFPPAEEVVGSFRLTDLHFPVILLVGLFLGVPDVPRRERLGNLGLALLVTAVFQVVLVLFWVKFTYATQLGAWSAEHYGPWGRNVWGLGKHLLDLPVKLALPLLLWAGFYLDRLLPGADRD